MKKVTKILALMLAAVTLLSVMAVPAFAEYTYTMTCTIYYVNGKGAQIASPCTFTVNAVNSSSSSTGRKSPSISGYVLKNSGDSFVTYDMMNKSFPSSNYDRKGSATYTVEYTDVTFHTINFIDRATGNALARAVVLGGKPGTSYTQNCPAFPNYTATKTVASGRFSTTSRSSSENIYYYKTIYTMSYNANGGSGAPSSESKESGKNYTISSVRPTRSGYSFAGWAMHDSATSASYQPGDTFTGNYNATFFAVWTANQYRISYDANGGSGAPSSQIKYNDVTLTLSYGKPSRSGYTFKGWGLSSSSTSATYQPGSTYNYNASRTLYAVWEKDAPPAPTTYTVSYNANGGSGAPSSQTKTKDIALTLSSTRPTKSGYTFKGWSESRYATSASYQPGGQYTANASTVLYAVWECSHPSIDTVWDTGCKWRNVCRICKATLSSGTTHGPYVYGNLEYYSESTHRRTKDCTHGDYSTYEYFSHNKTGKYQQYSSTQHKKYFYCNDCNSSIGTGYYESHDFITTTVDGQSTSVCLLCGYTKSSVKTYTVNYNANGGSRAPSSQTKIHDSTLILSNDIPYRSNYEFVGWATNSTASVASYYAGGDYTDNASVTLYAAWKYSPETYTVTFDANGGSGAPNSQIKTYGLTLTLSDAIPLRRNYSFVGWSKDRNATSASYFAGSSYTDNASVTLYAVWVYSPESYTVRYDANGGTGAPASQSKTYGVPLTLSDEKPVRSYYEFLGWAKSPDALSPEYMPGSSYNENEEVTLYAVWKSTLETYTVSYDANGGSDAPANQIKTEDIASASVYGFLCWKQWGF